MKWCLTLLVFSFSCRSANSTLVAKFSATATYKVAAFENRCQHTGGKFPPECTRCQDVINEAVWQAKVAEINKEQGFLPAQEQADLDRLLVELNSCP
jgi:hypothetical protein